MDKIKALELLREARISKQSVSYRKALNIINKMGKDFQLIIDSQKEKINYLSIGVDENYICENCAYCDTRMPDVNGNYWCNLFANRISRQDFCSRFNNTKKECETCVQFDILLNICKQNGCNQFCDYSPINEE